MSGVIIVVPHWKNWKFSTFVNPTINELGNKIRKTQIADIVYNKNAIYKAWAENGNDERNLTKLWKCEENMIDMNFWTGLAKYEKIITYFSSTTKE